MTTRSLRVIPTLLLAGKGLVKGKEFTGHTYVGDPINTMRLFNEKLADEVILLDIDARVEGRRLDLELITRIADECYVPLAVGGGLTNLDDVARLIRSGVEKVVLNTASVRDPQLIRQVSDRFGAQSVTVCVDFIETADGRRVVTDNAKSLTDLEPLAWAERAVLSGAGEIIFNSVPRDGTHTGYDTDLIVSALERINVPVVAAGGAGTVEHIEEVLGLGASAAAGSMFVHFGRRRSVLISYPLSGRLRGKHAV
jgi:cyclase